MTAKIQPTSQEKFERKVYATTIFKMSEFFTKLGSEGDCVFKTTCSIAEK